MRSLCGCVAQLVEQRSPKSPVGGSNPSALVLLCFEEKKDDYNYDSPKAKKTVLF